MTAKTQKLETLKLHKRGQLGSGQGATVKQTLTVQIEVGRMPTTEESSVVQMEQPAVQNKP